MEGDRRRQISQLYHAALLRAVPERAAFVREACGGDDVLQCEVESLLALDGSAQNFLNAPAAGAAARLMTDVHHVSLIGRQLGAYRVDSLLGAGGMGDVYRARDTKLGRDVAIKVVADAFLSDPERHARFEREAHVLATLNHPHIGAIYGWEEADPSAGSGQAGVRALVLELVEGKTLAERLATGPLPIQEALTVARQIADALEAAHEKGIVHRDLKPGNIKITPDGTVKVLDFGLAKAAAGDASGPDLSQSPSISISGTREGVILGTAAYMSPEQARGQPIDKRTDIWAFGCVLYEMLAGKRVFGSEDVSDTLANVLKKEPVWTALPANTPAAICRLLRRALVKERRERLADIADARFEITEALTASSIESTDLPSASWRERRLGLIAGLVIGVTATTVAAWSLIRAAVPPAKPIARFVIALTADDQFSPAGRHVVALSPDGSHIAYVANQRLYVRALDESEPTPIRGTGIGGATGHGRNPFFSPDGQWIGFWQTGELKKVSIRGGVPVTICAAQNPFGVSWGADDRIVFGQGSAGIWRVSAAGGTPEVLIKVDAGQVAQGPQLLPGGALLFTLATDNRWDDAQIVVQSLGANDRRVLVHGGRDGRYLSSGHLVYGRNGTLFGVPLNLQRREVTGAAVPLIERVSDAGANSGDVHLSVSSGGALVYAPVLRSPQRTVVWVDRQGREEATDMPPRAYIYPRLSPDGERVAISVQDPTEDLWMYDLRRGTFTRLTFEGQNVRSEWTPDGARITFSSNTAGGSRNIYSVPADGSGGPERLTTSPFTQFPEDWAPDGKTLVFSELRPDSNWDIWTLSSIERKPQLFLRTPFHDGGRAFSPDGRWLAYYSEESGRGEVQVRPFPGPGAKWQISRDGGAEPVWASNGRELFYRSGDRLMVVDVKFEPTFSAGTPRVLFQRSYVTALPANFDVSVDGRRFLMIKPVAASGEAPRLVMVLNWTEELKRLVPTK